MNTTEIHGKRKGRIAIVTGADGGIGLEFCKGLARRGYDLLMVSNRHEQLQEAAARIANEYSCRTWGLTLDLTAADAPERVRDYLANRGLMESVEVLVNNAGIFSFDYLTLTSERRIDLFVDLHVRCVAQLCRIFGDWFSSRGHGYILNMSSMSCWMPMPGLALYASTKAFLRVFSRSLALELQDCGVRVMVATPGGIATDLFGLPENLMKLALRLHAVARPESFVEGALTRLFRGKHQYINGFLNRISIAAVGASPKWVRLQVKRRLLDRGIRRP